MRTLALAALAALVLPPAARGEGLRRLHGSLPRGLARMEAAGPAPPDLRLEHVIVFLGLRDRRGLEAVLAAQQDRRSPRFHLWLDGDEIAERFGPRRAGYERVRRWFVERGFEVVRDSPLRTTLVVAGTSGQVEAALATRIGLFRQADRVYHAPLVEPAVPESLAESVRGILGLDDLPTFRPLAVLSDGRTGLAPDDFATAYGVAPLQAAGRTGAGRSIAVVARSNFADSDVAAFSAQFLPGRPPLAPVRVFTGADPGILPDQGEQVEVLLDTQWAGSLAPGAQLNVVIAVPRTSGGADIPDALQTAVQQRLGDVVSISFGACEPLTQPLVTELFDAFYAIANAQGQTVVVASGDSGAQDCLPQRSDVAVSALASSPHAVAVGGTSFALAADGTVPSPLEESVWNDGFGASGGGQSSMLAMPRYQLAAGLAGLATGRAMPDIALAAGPRNPGYFIFQNGQVQTVGGTSAGTPAFAGMVALVNESVAQTRGIGGGLGQFVPALYRAGSAQTQGGPSVFRDVVTGSNGRFAAGPGFDLATGWGAPLGDALAAALDGPGRCEPEIDAAVPENGCLVPSNRGAQGCAGEWLVERTAFALHRGLPAVAQACQDGDAGCDADGTADGTCTFPVALCLNVFDFRILNASGPNRDLPRCRAGKVGRVSLVSPRRRRDDPVRTANRAALLDAFRGLPLPIALSNACTATVPLRVAVGDTLKLRARVSGTLGNVMPRLTLGCSAP